MEDYNETVKCAKDAWKSWAMVWKIVHIVWSSGRGYFWTVFDNNSYKTFGTIHMYTVVCYKCNWCSTVFRSCSSFFYNFTKLNEKVFNIIICNYTCNYMLYKLISAACVVLTYVAINGYFTINVTVLNKTHQLRRNVYLTCGLLNKDKEQLKLALMGEHCLALG